VDGVAVTFRLWSDGRPVPLGATPLSLLAAMLVLGCSGAPRSAGDGGPEGGQAGRSSPAGGSRGTAGVAGTAGAAGAAGAGTSGDAGAAAAISLCSLSVNDIIADQTRDIFYVSVRSDSPTNASSIAALAPSDGTVLWTMAMPDEPDRLAISDDGALLYVGNHDVAPGTVRRIDLATRTVDLQFQVGSIAQDGTFPMVPAPGVSGIAVLPGSPHTIVAVLTDLTQDGNDAVAVYDDGVRRPDVFRSSVSSIQLADAITVYTFDSYFTGGDMYVLNVTATGLTEVGYFGSVFADFTPDFRYEGGWLFGEDGTAFDPTSGQTVGSYTSPPGGPVVADSAIDRTYILRNNVGGLGVFVRNTFSLIQVVDLPFRPTVFVRIVRAPDGTLGANIESAAQVVCPVLFPPSLLQ
jgi:hypothetical protein